LCYAIELTLERFNQLGANIIVNISVFIAEGGPECLESKQEGIQKCLNETFGKYAESIASAANLTDLSNFNLPLVLFDEGQCK